MSTLDRSKRVLTEAANRRHLNESTQIFLTLASESSICIIKLLNLRRAKKSNYGWKIRFSFPNEKKNKRDQSKEGRVFGRLLRRED